MEPSDPTTSTSPADRVDALLEDWARERPDLDATPMAVVGRILHLGRVLEARANEALRGTGLNYTDLDVLATLRRASPAYRLTPTALRRSVLITSGAMTACLDRLEGAGLISRAAEPADRRSVTAELTALGRELIERAMGVRFEEARQAVSSLGAADQAHLAGLLRTLICSLAS